MIFLCDTIFTHRSVTGINTSLYYISIPLGLGINFQMEGQLSDVQLAEEIMEVVTLHAEQESGPPSISSTAIGLGTAGGGDQGGGEEGGLTRGNSYK